MIRIKTTQEFVNKLEEFLRSTIDEGFWEFHYEVADDAIIFNNFVIWGFDHDKDCECANCLPEEDEELEEWNKTEPYPYTHPIRTLLAHAKVNNK
jgi:hypothetical protein